MKPRTLFAASLIITSLAVAAPAPAADLPNVDSILAKYVTALGGKVAMEKVTSRVLKVKIEGENMSPSEGEVYAKMPNRQCTHIELTGVGTMEEGFDGTVAWAKSPWEGLRVKAGEELAKVQRDADFQRDLKLKTLYKGLTCTGSEKIGQDEAYILESKPTPSSKEKFWFNTNTGLMVRQESEFEGPQGTVNVTILPQEYKTFEGLKYPSEFKMKFSSGGQSFEFVMKIVEIKHNVPVDDAKFSKPAA